MLVIYGKKNARIKTYKDYHHPCHSCKALDMNVNVFMQYAHVYFIPIFPIPGKAVALSCNSCGERISNVEIEHQYEKKTRAPIWFYSLTILIMIGIAMLINSNINTQKEKERFVQSPKVGDVYFVKKNLQDSTHYFFLRLSYLNNDTVFFEHGSYVYNGYVSEMSTGDIFDKEDLLIFTKKELLTMLEKDEINSIERKQ